MRSSMRARFQAGVQRHSAKAATALSKTRSTSSRRVVLMVATSLPSHGLRTASGSPVPTGPAIRKPFATFSVTSTTTATPS